jgi:hypothetical protein
MNILRAKKHTHYPTQRVDFVLIIDTKESSYENKLDLITGIIYVYIETKTHML